MQVVFPKVLGEVLTDWRTRCPSPVWVFPSDEAASGHKAEPCKPWTRVLVRAECFRLVEAIARKEGWTDEEREREFQAVGVEAERLRTLAQGRAITASGDPLTMALDGVRQRATAAGINPGDGTMLDLRMHDLRRTLGSWATMTGANLTIVGKVLGHRSHQSSAVYARMNLDPVREAVEKASGSMLPHGVPVPRVP
jgi:integrase